MVVLSWLGWSDRGGRAITHPQAARRELAGALLAGTGRSSQAEPTSCRQACERDWGDSLADCCVVWLWRFVQAPSEPPQFFSQEDGPGFSCILYFAIKEETVEALKDLDKASPGIKLFSEFFK